MRSLVWVLVRLGCACFFVVALPVAGNASLHVQGYDPLRHERFSVEDGTAFIGEGLDFSGVGHASDGRWVTMISPTYFVSASHSFPKAGATATFYESNEKSSQFAHRYVVDEFTATMYWNGQPSDLKVGKLVVQEGSSEAILPEDNISWYPVLATDAFSYAGAELLVYGLSDRVGKNTVSRICAVDNRRDASDKRITQVMEFIYDTDSKGKGPDEAYTMSGDSGGPSFVVSNGQLALAGIHYYNWGSPPLPGYASGDSFVPAYLNQLTSFRINGDATGDQRVGFEDMDKMRALWGVVSSQDGAVADFSKDGYVGAQDLDFVRASWGQTGPAWWLNRVGDGKANAVPEPLWLLFLSGPLVLAGLRGPRTPSC